MKRVGRIVQIKEEKLEKYLSLHANPWSEVTKAIKDCNIVNFSIFHRDAYLFSYFEYIGSDYKADMSKLDGLTKEWLKETDSCQEPIETAKPGELWSAMEEVFYQM